MSGEIFAETAGVSVSVSAGGVALLSGDRSRGLSSTVVSGWVWVWSLPSESVHSDDVTEGKATSVGPDGSLKTSARNEDSGGLVGGVVFIPSVGFKRGIPSLDGLLTSPGVATTSAKDLGLEGGQ